MIRNNRSALSQPPQKGHQVALLLDAQGFGRAQIPIRVRLRLRLIDAEGWKSGEEVVAVEVDDDFQGLRGIVVEVGRSVPYAKFGPMTGLPSLSSTEANGSSDAETGGRSAAISARVPSV